MKTTFTARQREVLRRRLELAMCWSTVPGSYRHEATRLANVILDELEFSGFSASAQRRAVAKVVASLDEAAPLRSVSPAERDAPAAHEGADLSSGAAS